MEIYRKDDENIYHTFMWSDSDIPGKRRAILSSLPLYTIDDALLSRILHRNKITDTDAEQICTSMHQQRELAEKILLHSAVTEELPELTKKEFEQHPMTLSLLGLFNETDIFYTYEEYLEHLAFTQAYEKKHPNYSVKMVACCAFRNIQIIIHEGRWVLISKNKAPAIHFVVRHPKMRNALENFVVPIVDN